MASLLLDGFAWSFKQCTSAGSGPQLSAKEKRCIQQGFQTYVDSRSAIGQIMQERSSEGGSRDF